METPDTLNPQYVVDADGRRTAVLLSLAAFEALMGRIAALGAGPDAGDEPAESDWLRAAARSDAFSDLRDDRENMYSADDGVPFRP